MSFGTHPGHQIIKGWKIFTSTNNKYTYVTSSDSENVILNVSESSNFCLYLDSNKNSINFHLYDVINPFKWDKNNDLNLNFEYNVYIQLYKHINPVTLGKGVVKNDSTFFNERPKSTFNERFYPICDDKSTYLSYLVAFVGNSKISDKGRRAYRRLEYKPLK